jgi:3-hydroxyacyl-[acyl-carrier-protein] dehydratase
MHETGTPPLDDLKPDDSAPSDVMPHTQATAPALGSSIDVIDIERIMHAIPHRYPFLLLDRMVDVVLGTSAVGVKNVSVNENFFAGHFPNHPVMPGVLIIECMAQTAAVLVVETLGPGAAGKERHRGNVWKFHGIARVDGVAVAEATYSAMIMDHVPGS